MSKSFKSYNNRNSNVKREDEYSGWQGECAVTSPARKLYRRQITKIGRQFAKAQMAKEIDNLKPKL
jgi:hypothetical protein